MSDPIWATTRRLKAFVTQTSGFPSEKEFGSRVRAYYTFTEAFQFQESGSIGYAEDDHQYTANYKRLF